MPAQLASASRRTVATRLMVTLGVLAAIAALAWAPEPDPVPRRWQLDFKLGQLRMTTLDIAGQGSRSFFYLTYRVTNTSGQDLLLAPAFELSTSNGALIRSGRDVPADATRQVLDLLGNPFIEDQIGILGVIMQGEENTREGVVIWPVSDFQPGEVAIYATGFSGETKPYENREPTTGKPQRTILRKTFMARYDMPGELSGRGNEPFVPSEQAWIMR